MSKVNEEVLGQIRDELRARPNIPDGILFALAMQIDPSLEGMDPRTFHAHYVVPARRTVSPTKRRKRKPRPSRRVDAASPRRRTAPDRLTEAAVAPATESASAAPPEPAAGADTPPPTAPPERVPPSAAAEPTRARPERDRVRAALLDFARELAAADRAAELVGAFARIDHYVDQLLGGGAPDADRGA